MNTTQENFSKIGSIKKYVQYFGGDTHIDVHSGMVLKHIHSKPEWKLLLENIAVKIQNWRNLVSKIYMHIVDVKVQLDWLYKYYCSAWYI